MWKMLAVAIVAAPILFACTPQSADHYEFERKEFDLATVSVSKVEYPSLAALRAEARRRGVKVEQDRDLQAFGFVDPTEAACTIHIVAPDKAWRPEWIGHELAHCLYGRWHT